MAAVAGKWQQVSQSVIFYLQGISVSRSTSCSKLFPTSLLTVRLRPSPVNSSPDPTGLFFGQNALFSKTGKADRHRLV